MEILQSQRGLQFIPTITYPDIAITEGKFTFLTGESGCGKSTYLRLLNATVLPIAGNIQYRGAAIDIGMDIIEYRRKVVLTPQEVYLFDGTIETNFRNYYKMREESVPERAKMQEFLRVCCSLYPLDTLCDTLSGGERQRVFMAIFLSFNPEVLLLDEPTSALDEQTAKRMLTNLKSHCKTQDITVVAVCHSDELVRQFADIQIDLGKEARG